MIAAAQLARLGCGPAAAEAAPALEAAASRFDVSTGLRLAHFIAQAAHESALFSHAQESLGYSAERLTAVWPSRFPTLAAAQPFAHNPERLANKVYGGRLGNTGPDDGWRFRGRGYFQLTGRDNYAAAAAALGLPLVDQPDLVAAPEAAALTAAWFWSEKALNTLADADDVEAITRRINGGLVGLAERQALVARAKAIWAA